jgi:hypothetical protein
VQFHLHGFVPGDPAIAHVAVALLAATGFFTESTVAA